MVGSSYLPRGVGAPGALAAFGGERLGPAGLATVAPGPYWWLDPRAYPAAGSEASKKLRRRQPEPAPKPACTHTVAASCLQRGEGLGFKVCPRRPGNREPDHTGSSSGLPPATGLWFLVGGRLSLGFFSSSCPLCPAAQAWPFLLTCFPRRNPSPRAVIPRLLCGT